jgi:lysine 2,3-aminomutase
MPNYLVSASDDAVVLRNYEGLLIRYQAEDKPNTARPTATRGVSALLQGTKSALVPEGNERMARRQALPAVPPEEAPAGGPGCCGGPDDHPNGAHGAHAGPTHGTHETNGRRKELFVLNGNGNGRKG